MYSEAAEASGQKLPIDCFSVEIIPGTWKASIFWNNVDRSIPVESVHGYGQKSVGCRSNSFKNEDLRY